MVVLYDEAHKCKNIKTTNSLILKSLAETDAKIVLLSATICDKPEKFVIAGYVLKLYNSIGADKTWMAKVSDGYDVPMEGVHKELFPKRAIRIKIKDLGDKFPENKVMCQCFDIDGSEEIEEMYEKIKEAEEALRNKEEQSAALAQITYARMRIETIKAPLLVSLAKQYTDEGNSVAIFVNFKDTLHYVCEELKTTCAVHGDQTLEERDGNINSFQKDKSRIIVCTIRSGSVAISLHDLNGDHPRISVISPSWSAIDILQCLGRIHRAGSKSPARQIIVYAEKTIEKKMCEAMAEKIKTIGAINDGKVDSYVIDGLTDNKEIKMDEKSSELDVALKKVSILNSKKERIKKDLSDIDNEINTLNEQILKLLDKSQ